MNPWSLLGQLMGTILKFVPRIWFCPKPMSGVKVVRGRHLRRFGYQEDEDGKDVGRYVVVYWPFWTTIYVVNGARHVGFVDGISASTSDDVSVHAAIVVTYHVTDPVQFLVWNHDADSSVDEVVASCVQQIVKDREWGEIRTLDLGESLGETAGLLLEDFGIEVESVSVRSLARTKVLHVVGDVGPTVLTSDDE